MFISLKPTKVITSITPSRTYFYPTSAKPQSFERGILARTKEVIASDKRQQAQICIPNRKFSSSRLLKTYFTHRPICFFGHGIKYTGQQQSPNSWFVLSRAFSTTGRLAASSSTSGDNDSGNEAQQPSQREFKTLLLTRPSKYVASIELNRPKAKNAFSLESAVEFVELFKILEEDSTVRCAVLSGNGSDFTSGVDIKSFMTIYGQLQENEDVARRTKLIHTFVEKFQAPFKVMHSFSKPIICVHHGLALGLAMELAACCDIRYCSRDARMAIREVLIGIAADVGSLQLMPRLASNQSLLHELAYTGRFMTADEALQLGFVSRILDTKEAAMSAALELATTISRRSPLAVQGTKKNLQFSRDKSFLVGLEYNAIWNAAMLQGGDVVKAIGGILSKQNEDEIEYDDF